MPSGFDLVAIYAAVVATSSFVFGVYQYRSGRRRKLDVDVSISTIVNAAIRPKHVVSFRARNSGVLPVRVTQCGLAGSHKKMFRVALDVRLSLPIPSFDLGSPTFPADVEAHQTFTCYADVAVWCRGGLPDGRAWSDYDRVYFVDGIGRYHSAKVSDDFHAEIERECAEATDREETTG